jgi:nucleoid-associated protein YgaU
MFSENYAMKINNFVRPLFIMMLVLGLAAGCASTSEESGADQAAAEQAIADAKSTNAQAKKMGAEWRDTGKMIKSAEAASEAGDYDKAVDLANKAQRQAENAMKQAKDQQATLEKSGAIGASEDQSSSRQGGAMIAGDNQYEVTSGDNLWSISGKGDIYANPYQWPLIYKANRDKIKDADLIYSGQILDIDRDASSADVDAAISHAKSRGAWSIGVTEASDEAYLAE